MPQHCWSRRCSARVGKLSIRSLTGSWTGSPSHRYVAGERMAPIAQPDARCRLGVASRKLDGPSSKQESGRPTRLSVDPHYSPYLHSYSHLESMCRHYWHGWHDYCVLHGQGPGMVGGCRELTWGLKTLRWVCWIHPQCDRPAPQRKSISVPADGCRSAWFLSTHNGILSMTSRPADGRSLDALCLLRQGPATGSGENTTSGTARTRISVVGIHLTGRHNDR